MTQLNETQLLWVIKRLKEITFTPSPWNIRDENIKLIELLESRLGANSKPEQPQAPKGSQV